MDTKLKLRKSIPPMLLSLLLQREMVLLCFIHGTDVQLLES